MRVLLDTQVWLWMQSSVRRFSDSSLELLHDERNELLLSSASAWEIAIKYAIGKLPLPAPPDEYVPDRMVSSGVSPLRIEISHALQVAELPLHHRDPFDRLLIAQSSMEGVPVMTGDRRFALYDIDVLWAA